GRARQRRGAAPTRPPWPAGGRWPDGRTPPGRRRREGADLDDPSDEAGTEHTRSVTTTIDRPAALDRFLTALEARDASPNTRRAYATAVGAYLAWLDERGIDWRAPDRLQLRAYLATLSEGRARSSVAQ